MPYSSKICGIYSIKNNLNNKVYIGYSTDIRSRLYKHKHHLRLNKHNNKHLQLSFNKYSENNFSFEVLEECDQQFLCSQENYWCNLLNSHNKKFGYNIKPTGINKFTPMNNETKNKLSIHMKNKIKNDPEYAKKINSIILKMNKNRVYSDKDRNQIRELGKSCSKTILQFTTEGEFVKEWKSITEATISCKGSIKDCLSGRQKTSAGFIWKYK